MRKAGIMDASMATSSELRGMCGMPTTPAKAFEPVRVARRGKSMATAVSTPAPGPDADTGEEPRAGFAPRARSELACRVLNVTVALLLITLTLPLTVITALVIKLTSQGPVFYSQTRVGLDRRWNRARALYERRREDLGGEQFTIIKFRSMRVDAESAGQAVWATKGDDRVTPVGRFIRATRIDELPQLLNVLRGDMNVVGPRPERPSIFVRLREDISLFPVRQRVKPGITGWAQINRSYDTDIEGVREKLRLDIEYLQSQSLLTDVSILLKTVPVVVFRRGGW
jgi:lipopolysaccharide/colanic/teichoic acid biosynthesis glycosyltransferase